MWTTRKANIHFVQLAWFTIKSAGTSMEKRFTKMEAEKLRYARRTGTDPKQSQSLEKFQKFLNLREPVAGGLAEQIRVADERRTVLPGKCLGIAVEIL